MSFTIKCYKCGALNSEIDIEKTSDWMCDPNCGCEGYDYSLNCRDCDFEIHSGSEYGEFNAVDIGEEIAKDLKTRPTNSNEDRKNFDIIGDSVFYGVGVNDIITGKVLR